MRSYLLDSLPGQVYDVLGEKDNTVEMARRPSQISKIIVAVGGDGTVADVMQGIIEAQKEKEVVLGIVHFGRGTGTIDGRRDRRRILFVIFSLPGTRGLGDFRLVRRLEQLQGRIPALSSRC